jgi:hypothetical protein
MYKMKNIFTLLVIVSSFICGCSSEFNTKEQASNEVNENGFREGRWVDFLSDYFEYVTDTSKGYKFYLLSEFQDGRLVGESKLFNKNGVLIQLRKAFDEDSSKFKKLLVVNFDKKNITISEPFNSEKITHFNENGQITIENRYNKNNFLIEELTYSTSGNNIGTMVMKETMLYDSAFVLNKVEGVLYNDGEVSKNYTINLYNPSNYLKTTDEFRKLFENRLAEEANKLDIPDSIIIRKALLPTYPYQIISVTCNNKTLEVFNLLQSEVNKFAQKRSGQSVKSVICKYCGKSFDKSQGYVFNINVTIDHACSYSHYNMMSSMMNASGVSSSYLNKFSDFFCSQRCCNFSGYSVWD